jgi:hypothetical protein
MHSFELSISLARVVRSLSEATHQASVPDFLFFVTPLAESYYRKPLQRNDLQPLIMALEGYGPTRTALLLTLTHHYLSASLRKRTRVAIWFLSDFTSVRFLGEDFSS